MKKTLSLMLAVVFVFALLAACGKTPTPAVTPTAGPPAVDVAAPDTPPPETPEPESPYKLAAGNFEKNAEGYPTAPYEYEIPLSTTDEVFTYWTVVWQPQYLPEDGYGAMEYPTKYAEMTGVNVEYVTVSSDTRMENFSVLLNSDMLCDVMTGAAVFYPGPSIAASVTDGYFINIYDYMDYCPNYIYQSTYNTSDKLTKETVFYSDDMIITFYSMLQQSLVPCLYMARGDWLDKLGMKNDDIVLYDDLFDMLSAFKSQIDTCTFPWPLLASFDMAGTYNYTSYDTLTYINPYGLPQPYVFDGQVQFGCTTERDRDQIKEFNRFYAAGLIDPNWTSYNNNTAYSAKIRTGEVGYSLMSPGEIKDYETGSTDPNATWVPLHKPAIQEDQTFHVGGTIARTSYGSASVSAKCSNLPLMVTWMDYRYSPAGSFYASWGPEGALWEYNDDGQPMATEWALNNPDGIGYAWMCMLYGINSLAEHGLEDGYRKYAYPGGERMKAVHDYWADYSYDGAYEFPIGARLTAEESEEVNSISGDIITYIAETCPTFLDGSRSFSEWETYTQELNKLQLQKIIDIYQIAYERYMKK